MGAVGHPDGLAATGLSGIGDGMRILTLTSPDMVPGADSTREDIWELEAHLAELEPEAKRRGYSLDLRVWSDPTLCADEYDAVVVGTPWDYAHHVDHFLRVIDRLASQTLVFNSPAVIRWNSDKTYLQQLGNAGVPTIPTLWLKDIGKPDIRLAHAHFGAAGVVIKRVVGAGAKGQVMWTGEGPIPAPSTGRVMVQPFLPAAQTEGELSLIYFDGAFSHAAQKRPKAGDYRVQSIYGGTDTVYSPDTDALAVANQALDAVKWDLLYARVDLMRHEGRLCLMELEVIEPYLYAVQGPGMGAHFFDALERLVRRSCA
ncbi:MAG: glutathione synthase/RimK-type ligase-like ATP-grasp enzyme [Myxococcota bacterium]